MSWRVEWEMAEESGLGVVKSEQAITEKKLMLEQLDHYKSRWIQPPVWLLHVVQYRPLQQLSPKLDFHVSISAPVSQKSAVLLRCWMSEVEGLAELGLLPNQLKHTQTASAVSIYIKLTTPMAQYGNLTGPTSICWESGGVGMQKSLLASVTEEGFRPGHRCVPLCISVYHCVTPHCQLLLVCRNPASELFPLTS